MKLDSGQKHFLRLIDKGSANPTGWAPVSHVIFPLVKQMPSELIEYHSVGTEGRGEVRLTEQGRSVLNAMEWL